MGLGHSPSIVTSGLVLALDAGNTKSYPNTGTVWTDLSGNGNTGTLTNGPTFNSYDARTNGNLYSEQFNNAVYSINQGTISTNQAVSPDGTTTAENLTASAGTVNPYAYQAVTTATSSVYTFSVYVKKNTHDFVQIVLNGVSNGFANFNISSGVVGTLGSGGSATSSIVNAGNGWYRCIITYTTATTSGNGYINLIGSATSGRNATFSAAGTESVYLWGQQLELGSFATSYIPTTSSAVTRSAGPAALVFDGVNDYGNVTITSTTVFCAEIWVFFNGNIGQDADMTSITGYQCASFSYQPGGAYSGSYDGFTLGSWTSAATNETIGYFHNSSFRYIIDPISAGWHQIGINWNSSSGSYDIYVDGTIRTTYSGTFYSNIPQFSTTKVALGSGTVAGSGQYFFNGKIAAAKLWNSSITADQVLQNFNALRGRFGL